MGHLRLGLFDLCVKVREMPDWTVLDLPGVAEALDRAAEGATRRYQEVTEYDDQRQEADYVAACMPQRVRECVEGVGRATLGTLSHEVEMDLIDMLRPTASARARETSYEERYEGDGDYAPRPAAIAVRPDTILYDRRLVEALMPAIWDESYCFGIRQENAPDSDMPRGSMNPATGNTLAAHIADIKVGWERAPLTRRERVALLLAYGFDWQVTEIAAHQGNAKSTISERVTNGIGKIVATLNGTLDLSHLVEDETTWP